jgi:hypothetical protein
MTALPSGAKARRESARGPRNFDLQSTGLGMRQVAKKSRDRHLTLPFVFVDIYEKTRPAHDMTH